MYEGLEDLSLVGGRPALDFVNTEGGNRNGPPERLGSYADLVAWSAYAGVVDEAVAKRLRAAGARAPGKAAAVFARAVDLREALYRIFGAVMDGAPVADEDRGVLDSELTAALGHRHLEPDSTGGASVPAWVWRFDEGDDAAHLALPLWLLVTDAADLLGSDRLDRVKECGGEDCTWLFLDESRNHSRRWCEMGECGNRAKARRYRRRHGG
jgi:predicted RNA-binding Zn ribbon-like protein